MKSRTFKLEDRYFYLLKQEADKRGISQAEAVRLAIVQLCEEPVCNHDATTVQPSDEADWKALYFEERERFNQAHASLEVLTGKVAESLQASQAIRIADKSQLILESAEQKLTRWQRLKRAWKG